MKRAAVLLLCLGCSNTQNDEDPGGFVLDAMPDGGAADMGQPPPPGADLIINEASASADYIELVNRGNSLDLTGWSVTDDGYDPMSPETEERRFRLPAMILPAGERMLLETLPFGIGGDDGIFLLDPTGAVADVADWAEGEADPAFCRLPDGQGDFQTCQQTPGTTNLRAGEMPAPDGCGDDLIGPDEFCDGASLAGRTCESFGLRSGTLTCDPTCQGYDLDGCLPGENTPPVIAINEVTAKGDDFIELVNNGDAPVDLAGWWIHDAGYDPADPMSDTQRYTLPGGMLGPGEYRVLVKDVDHTFGLGGEDGVWLYNATDTLVDQTQWPQDGADPAWCRPFDGTSGFETCADTTPGESNVTAGPAPMPECGDGEITGAEVCDGSALDGRTCGDEGFDGGTLGCAADCRSFETSACVNDAPPPPAMAVVVINEVRSSGDDEIELHNLGDGAADLTGWAVADAGYDAADEATLDHLHVLDGTLAPGEYRVLVKDVDHGFGLGGEDSVRLFDAAGEIVDETAWPADGAATAWCRQPNGTGDFATCDELTLGDSND